MDGPMRREELIDYPIAFGLPATVPITTTASPVVCRACGKSYTVPEVLSSNNCQKQNGMLAFFCVSFLCS